MIAGYRIEQYKIVRQALSKGYERKDFSDILVCLYISIESLFHHFSRSSSFASARSSLSMWTRPTTF